MEKIFVTKNSWVYELFSEWVTRINEHKKGYQNKFASIHSTFSKHLINNLKKLKIPK